MRQRPSPVQLQTFRQTYELLMDGVQGRSKYHSKTDNQAFIQNARIHSINREQKRKLPELKVKDRQPSLPKQIATKSIQQDTREDGKEKNGSLKMDPKVKRALSIQCKNNFIQFLVVQHAGKAGDFQMFERFKDIYQSQLFDQTVPKPKARLDKKQISYLKLEEENQDDIDNQVQTILHKKVKKDRVGTPLDDFIRNVHETNCQRLPKIISQDQSFNSNIESFHI